MKLRWLSVLLTVALAAACGGQAPTPSPGGFSDVIAQLVLRGVTVQEHVSGDDGCPRVELHDNAARLTVSIGEDATRQDVYLFRWRREADYLASVSSFFMCVTDFRSQAPGGVIDVVESSPWRAFGTGWSDQLETAIRESIAATSSSR